MSRPNTDPSDIPDMELPENPKPDIEEIDPEPDIHTPDPDEPEIRDPGDDFPNR